jgi:hypothetical protein
MSSQPLAPGILGKRYEMISTSRDDPSLNRRHAIRTHTLRPIGQRRIKERERRKQVRSQAASVQDMDDRNGREAEWVLLAVSGLATFGSRTTIADSNEPGPLGS